MERCEHKEANQGEDAANKKCAAAQCKTTLNQNESKIEWDRMKTTVITVKLKGMISCGSHASFKLHNWNHP